MSSTGFFLDLIACYDEFGGKALVLMCRNEPACLFKQAIHLLKGDALSLWQKCPKENGVSDIADDKEEEIPPAL